MRIEEVMSETKRLKVRKQLDERRNVILSQVQAVVKGYTSALFVYGPGGLGKTHLITQELDNLLGKGWAHHTAFTTPKGLILTLAEKPDYIHVFEDCETLYKTEVASSILRAACGSPRSKERIVSYETAHEKFTINFRGGIIIVSNESLSKAKGPMAAVASRFRPIKWDMTLDERICSILDIADQGWEKGMYKLSPVQCRLVAKVLIEEMASGKVDVPVELRTFTEHALPGYAQSLTGEQTAKWEDVLRAKLSGSVNPQETRDAKSNRLRVIAAQIQATPGMTVAKKVAAWKEKTGLGQAIFYRHLKETK